MHDVGMAQVYRAGITTSSTTAPKERQNLDRTQH
jgi:hypothetical protein